MEGVAAAAILFAPVAIWVAVVLSLRVDLDHYAETMEFVRPF